MQKRYCDRCETEILEKGKYKQISFSDAQYYNSEKHFYNLKEFDLCSKCATIFEMQFMTGKEVLKYCNPKKQDVFSLDYKSDIQ